MTLCTYFFACVLTSAYIIGVSVSEPHTSLFNCDFSYIRESVDSLCRDDADVQYMQYLSKCPITYHKYAKNLFKHLVFLFASLYDQQDSYKCPTATWKTAKHKSVQL